MRSWKFVGKITCLEIIHGLRLCFHFLSTRMKRSTWLRGRERSKFCEVQVRFKSRLEAVLLSQIELTLPQHGAQTRWSLDVSQPKRFPSSVISYSLCLRCGKTPANLSRQKRTFLSDSTWIQDLSTGCSVSCCLGYWLSCWSGNRSIIFYGQSLDK